MIHTHSQATLHTQTRTETPATSLPLPFSSLCDMLPFLVEQDAKAKEPLFITREATLDAEGFVKQVLNLRDYLQEHWTLAPGDKVALLFWNQPEFFTACFALRLLGWVPVPVNVLMAPQDVGYVLHHADIRGVLATEELALQVSQSIGISAQQLPFPVLVSDQLKTQEMLQSFNVATHHPTREGMPLDALYTDLKQVLDASPRNTQELALLMYTSGTTGNPKGVMLSEHNLLSNLAGFADRIHLNRDDEKALIGLPLFHSYGFICGLYALSLRASLVFVPKFQPKAILELLEREAVSFLPLVPTMFTILLQAARRIQQEAHVQKPFPHLRICISGGAALPEALLNAVQGALGVRLLEGYGLTETSPVLAVNSSERGAVFGAVGTPLKNVAIRLVHPDSGELLPLPEGQASEEGEIQARGENIMLGYYKDDAATAAVLSQDGWFKTGDLGHVDAEGLLRISGGRLKDLIIRAGENIAPLPIERILAQHPKIANVAVIPKRDDRLGEAICACIEVEPEAWAAGIEERTIERECSQLVREQLSTSFTPDAYYFTEHLPKTPTGKILKKQIHLPD
jgi:long-chain acyl-CoA synthetase